MIDPLTAIAVATKAFNTVNAMVAAGRDVEDTLGQIGAWYGACSDFNEAKKQAENPPLFKRLVARQSVEQEAMEIYAKEKKIKQQEKELRELLMYTYGPTGYTELVALRRKIKDQREKTIYAQERKRKAVFWTTVQLGALTVLVYTLYIIIKLLIGMSNGNGI